MENASLSKHDVNVPVTNYGEQKLYAKKKKRKQNIYLKPSLWEFQQCSTFKFRRCVVVVLTSKEKDFRVLCFLVFRAIIEDL